MGLPAIPDKPPLNCVCGCPPHDSWCHGGCGGCSIYEPDNGDDGKQRHDFYGHPSNCVCLRCRQKRAE